jgi:hypothetical protein
VTDGLGGAGECQAGIGPDRYDTSIIAMRRLPPLKALRAFEAAARHMSFKAATDELGLTPTAISRQIRLLETVIGEVLFRPRPRPLTLTSAGKALFPVVRSSFDSIAEAFATFRRDIVAGTTATDTQLDSPNIHRPEQPALAVLSAPRLSIVVLPFSNIGCDHEQEYFVDGISESLTTDLSRISGAFVVARSKAAAPRRSRKSARSPAAAPISRLRRVRPIRSASSRLGPPRALAPGGGPGCPLRTRSRDCLDPKSAVDWRRFSSQRMHIYRSPPHSQISAGSKRRLLDAEEP